MKFFVRYDDYGNVRQISINPDLASVPESSNNTTIIDLPEKVNFSDYYIDLNDLSLIAYTPSELLEKAQSKPYGVIWDAQNKEWIDTRDIDEIKQMLIEQCKQERIRRIDAGFIWSTHKFDYDAQAKANLVDMYNGAKDAPENFPINWRLYDNSWLSISASDGIAIYTTATLHKQAHFTAFGVHEAAILAETDIAVLQSYDITTGWPE